MTSVYLAMGLATVGDFSRATAIAEEAARLSVASDTSASRVWVLYGLSAPALWRGEYETAMPWLEKGLALVHELRYLIRLPRAAAWLGYAYARTGRVAEGLGLLEEATIQGEIRNRGLRARHQALQSEALLLGGRAGDARAVAQRGLEGARARAERGYAGLCLLALGEAEAYGDPPDLEAATTHLREALALATELGMRPLVAHCHAGLAKLYRRTGKRVEATEHLQTATTMYHDMGMTYWLEKAQTESAGAL